MRFPAAFKKEFKVFGRLNTPQKVQDFLDDLRINFRETCRSPLEVLRYKEAHCMEGAMLAAAIFWYHGKPPLLLDLKTTGGDDDHVVAVFKDGNRWGAVSKTNHAVLRYRDPIYKNMRELALSYFNEYFLDDGVKTLRSYSKPFGLGKFGRDWLLTPKNLEYIADALDHSPHVPLFPKTMAGRLRRAHPLERKAGKLTEWKRRPR